MSFAEDRPLGVSSFETRSVEEASHFFTGHYAPVHVSPGHVAKFDVEVVDAITIGGVCFTRTRSGSGIDFRFESSFDGYGLTLPGASTFEFDSGRGRALRAGPGQGLMVDSSSITHARFLPGSAWHRIAVTTQEMHERLQSMTRLRVPERLRFDPEVRMGSATARTAYAIMEAVRIGIEGSAPLTHAPAAMTSLREAVVHLMLETLPHSYTLALARRCPAPSPRHLRRALEYLHAHAAGPVRLDDVAAAAGVSARALQQAFQQFRGTSPMRYLRQIRLDGARVELEHALPGTTVSQVAYRWGFPHPGLFATHYARVFGETPSSTLRRGHARA